MIRRKTIKVSVTTTRNVTVVQRNEAELGPVIELRPVHGWPAVPVATSQETDPAEPKRV